MMWAFFVAESSDSPVPLYHGVTALLFEVALEKMLLLCFSREEKQDPPG